ncbi:MULTISPECIES: hypothetical protein [Calothrix]|uniref:Uncharacterized protein n=2 Tax=Calothrix TaxID=1186 RepID=A0ABR8ADZ2_9CYAN|nr:MULTISPECIES: hypothetical protein [Calothrix]MBD2197730.1 hypothetical protein [Calothrix parietina FACHB-288]MBD2225659.1 hypothetical protein [Calothrix anomala FACHB-343]
MSGYLEILKYLSTSFYCQQSTVNGQQSTVNSQRSTVNSQQSTVNSLKDRLCKLTAE